MSTNIYIAVVVLADMSPARPVLVSLLVVTVVLASFASTPAAANSCADSKARSIQSHGGNLWVLESTARNASGVVYEFDDQKEQLSRHELGAEINRTEPDVEHQYELRFSSFAPATNGGWWLLAEGGSVYRFTERWNYTGQSDSIGGYDNYDLARTAEGWWVLRRGGLVQFDQNWTKTKSHNTGQFTGFPTLGLYGEDDRLWLVDSESRPASGGAVTRLSVTGSGEDTTVTRDRSWQFDWEVDRVWDLVRTENGQWAVVEGDGGVAEYTGYWQFTGQKQEVTNAIGYCGITFAPMVTFVVFGIVALVSVIGLAALMIRHRSGTEKEAVGLLSTGLGWFASVLFGFHALPSPGARIYWMPDAVLVAGLLAIPVFTIGTLRGLSVHDLEELTLRRCFDAIREDRRATAKLSILVVLAHSPILFVAWALL